MARFSPPWRYLNFFCLLLTNHGHKNGNFSETIIHTYDYRRYNFGPQYRGLMDGPRQAFKRVKAQLGLKIRARVETDGETW